MTYKVDGELLEKMAAEDNPEFVRELCNQSVGLSLHILNNVTEPMNDVPEIVKAVALAGASIAMIKDAEALTKEAYLELIGGMWDEQESTFMVPN